METLRNEIGKKGGYTMKNKDISNSQNRKSNEKGVSPNYLEPEKLSENEKRTLQVKDGQHNHYVDERGGAD